jgi:hypothetical protein
MAKRNMKRPTERRPPPNDDAMREKGFSPFLRPEHTRENEWFLMTGWNVIGLDSKKLPQIKIELQNEQGQNFVLGVREGSPDHRILFHAFGSQDYRAWPKGAIKVKVVAGTQGDMRFINVAEADPDPPIWADR